MRTTITLEDDVAALLSRLQKSQDKSFKQLVNEALRRGLRELTSPPARRKAYRTPGVDLGRCLIGDLDDVAEALAVAEGESFR